MVNSRTNFLNTLYTIKYVLKRVSFGSLVQTVNAEKHPYITFLPVVSKKYMNFATKTLLNE